MRFIVLGAAAGGGLPQWNCGCDNCNAARSGRIAAMSQSSVAVSLGRQGDGRDQGQGGGHDWAIINASPDIRAQMAATRALWPAGRRGSPLRSVLLTNGDIDHVAGLLTLRESQPFDLFATPAIHATLAENPLMAALAENVVIRRRVALDQAFDLLPGLRATLFAVPGKVPLYQEGEVVETGLVGETTIGVELVADGRRALCIPGCADIPDWLQARIAGADLLLLDGTLWTDDEMIRLGLGHKTGARMGHVAASRAIGLLAGLDLPRRVFVHVNNSNPLVDPASPESAEARAHGWQVGHDGMEIEL